MTIRRYLIGEEPAIWDVYFRATHETNAADYHIDLLNRWAPPDMNMGEWTERLREKNPFVALVDGHIVGFAELDGDGFIDYFYVSPDHQRQGIGAALMTTLVSEALALRLTAIRADVSITAKAFFAAHAFEVVESRTTIILCHPAPNFAMVRHLRAGTNGTDLSP